MQPHQGKERVLGVKTRETEEERTIADKKWTLEGTAQCHKAGEIGGLQLQHIPIQHTQKNDQRPGNSSSKNASARPNSSA